MFIKDKEIYKIEKGTYFNVLSIPYLFVII